MPDEERTTREQAQPSAPTTTVSATVGQVLEGLGASVRKQARKWVEKVVVEPLREAALKVVMLALLFVSVILTVIYVTIGLAQLLDALFAMPGVQFLLMGLVTALMALLAGWAVGRDREKGKEKAR